MFFRELNLGKCKTYLIGCDATRKALLIDPLKEHIEDYLKFLNGHDWRLDAVVDTHTHADHPTASFALNERTGARIIMDRHAPAPRVTEHVSDGDQILVGEIELNVLYTPGHTPDSISLHVEDRVFTGDVLLIGGTGRADFAGGDAGEQYDSITQKLFKLPNQTRVYPAHDYRGNTESTIEHEKLNNPRIAGRTREEYITLMASLKFPLPDKIQEVLQPNQSAIDDDLTRFPNFAELNQVRQLTPDQLYAYLESGKALTLVDVREPAEYTGELGHISGSLMIPLQQLVERAIELEQYKNKYIVCICRAGVRSTTAAAILIGLGFMHVDNLQGGMLAWSDKGLPRNSVAQ